MASIENSTLYGDIFQVFNTAKQEQFYRWDISLIVNGKPLPNVSMQYLTYVHDYLENYGADISCSLLIPDGAYHRDVVPNETQLLVSVVRIPLKDNKDQNNNRDNLTSLYRAVLVNGPSRNVKGSTPDNMAFTTADLSNITPRQFQLLELSVEAMRKVSVGLILLEQPLATAIRYILTSVSNQLKLPDSDSIRGVDICTVNNDEVYEELVIPDGKKLYDVPGYLQEQYGVYSSGLSCYLSRGLWYVFPRYDITRYDKESDTLTVVNAPANKFPHVEASYVQSSRETIILATGEISHVDDVAARQYNVGSGARFTDGNKVFGGFTEYKDGEVSVAREDNNVEFISDNSLGEDRVTVPVSSTKITTNAYAEFSKLARSKVEVLSMEWHNSDPFLLYPGQPVRFIYQMGKGSGIRKGVLAGATHHITGSTPGMAIKHYSCNSALSLLIEKEPVGTA